MPVFVYFIEKNIAIIMTVGIGASRKNKSAVTRRLNGIAEIIRFTAVIFCPWIQAGLINHIHNRVTIGSTAAHRRTCIKMITIGRNGCAVENILFCSDELFVLLVPCFLRFDLQKAYDNSEYAFQNELRLAHKKFSVVFV